MIVLQKYNKETKRPNILDTFSLYTRLLIPKETLKIAKYTPN